MLIVNLFAPTHIITLIVNCNLLLSLLAEKSLIIIFVSLENSIKVLLIEQVGMSLINKIKSSNQE